MPVIENQESLGRHSNSVFISYANYLLKHTALSELLLTYFACID